MPKRQIAALQYIRKEDGTIIVTVRHRHEVDYVPWIAFRLFASYYSSFVEAMKNNSIIPLYHYENQEDMVALVHNSDNMGHYIRVDGNVLYASTLDKLLRVGILG